jgi:hypothetical protein
MAFHIALLGDSIFDNAAYTRGEPDVVSHLRALLPAGWQASLLAVDGSTTRDLPEQLRRMPADATHLVVAVGGNDALLNIDLLDMRVASTREALLAFGRRVAAFESDYRRAIALAAATRLPIAACTIYNGGFSGEEADVVRVALTMFNDAILRVLLQARADVIELRRVCTEPADYANPIEPSGAGGRKIAQAIVRTCTGAGNNGPVSKVFG